KISRPAEKTTPWYQYRRIFMDDKRINNGVAFYRQHQKVLHEAYEKYGVPAAIIVAIIGVETRYGKVMGNDKVITALATIGFDYPKREAFFSKELRAFLQMAAEEQFDPLTPMGSYAGAMGMAQFMPSSYLNFAVDYEGDGKRDLWKNPNDAIFSIANYLQQHGWQRDGLIVDEAVLFNPYTGKHGHKPFTTLGELHSIGVFSKQHISSDDTRVGYLVLDGEHGELPLITFNNFATITTYNTSPLYAMAVAELSRAIEAKRQATP
ncbi:MAG: lytic murein transglycosylase B, partial [Gammaproteobacteria bacterium]